MASTTTPTLCRRALNRATLDRQLLLRRSSMAPTEAIEHLVGLQAQTAQTWYVGLWTRLEDFAAESVSTLLDERRVVRIPVMRSTIHLVTARDGLTIRPLVQQVIERSAYSNHERFLSGVDLDALAETARTLVDAGEPLTPAEIGQRLAERWPGNDPTHLSQVVRARVPMVQVPPRGMWRANGSVRHRTVEAWLGQPLDPIPDVDRLVLRYLAAFGPATPRDAQVWSGLTRLAEVFDRLRPGLLTFRDEHGRELFDLPDAPRPDPDTETPTRFLYDFDNVLLSHADRSRMLTRPDEPTPQSLATRNGMPPSAFLVDGFVTGIWRVTRTRDAATLDVRPFRRLSSADLTAVTEEGSRLLEFLAEGTRHDVTVHRS